MAFSWTPARLPEARMPTTQPIDLSPLDRGIQTFVKGQKEANDLAVRQNAGQRIASGDTTGASNALFEAGMLDQGIGLQNTVATQKRNAADDAAKAAQRAAGLAQMAANETDPARKQAIWKRVQSLHPGMSQGIAEAGYDPNDIDGAAKFVIAEARGYLDPTAEEAKSLGNQKTRAEIAKLSAEAANGGSAYGKAGTIVQGNDGRFYSVQFSSNGQRRIEPLELGGGNAPPTGSPAVPGASGPTQTGIPDVAAPARPPVSLSPSRGVGVEGNLMYDRTTGAPIRDVSANIAGGKSAGVQGEAQGKAVVNLPIAENAADRMLSGIDALLTPKSGLDRVTGSVYGRLPEWTNFSDEAKNAQSQIDFVNSNTFLQAYNDLRGAGAITENEGQAASKAYNRLLSQQLGTSEYKKALGEFREQVVRLRDIAKARASGGNVTGVASQPKSFNWTPDGGLQEAN